MGYTFVFDTKIRQPAIPWTTLDVTLAHTAQSPDRACVFLRPYPGGIPLDIHIGSQMIALGSAGIDRLHLCSE